MKKIKSILALVLVSALLAGFGGLAGLGAQTPKSEVLVAAAASLTDAMNEIVALYAAAKPGVKIVPTYGSSGSLQKQVEQGAPVDIFISAGARQVKALADQSLLVAGSQKNLLQNTVVLIVPKGKTGITSFADLGKATVKQVALGEPSSVPVGQYSGQIFKFLGILDAVKAKAVYAKDVRQVLAYVESGEVDAGVVYATDAAISRSVTVVAAPPAGSHDPVVYPAALVKSGTQGAAAKEFLDWLSKETARKVFQKYGFVVL